MANGITLENINGGSLTVQYAGTATGDRVLTLPEVDGTIEDAIAPYNHGFKNHIINGNFDVWQRGSSFTTGNEYTADRWKSNTSGIVARSADVPTGSTYSARLTKVGSVGAIEQGIELNLAGNAGVFAVGKIFTLSFMVKSNQVSEAINVGINFRDSAYLSTNSVSVVPLTVIGTATNSWSKVSYTFTINSSPNLSNLGLFVLIYGSVAGAEVRVTQIQLEEGSVATPFEQRPYGLELSLCQRYYEVVPFGIFSGNVVTSGSYSSYIGYKEVKRVIPTIVTTHASSSGFDTSAPTVFNSSISSFSAAKAANSNVNAGYFAYSATASAEL